MMTGYMYAYVHVGTHTHAHMDTHMGINIHRKLDKEYSGPKATSTES